MTRLVLPLLLSATALAAEPAKRPPLVAVMYFDIHSNDEELKLLRKGFAQMMISDLANAGQVRVVDRDRLEEIMAEQKLQASKAFDPDTGVKVGKLLGARYLVSGFVMPIKGTVRFDSQIRSVESGQVLQSVSAMGTDADVFAAEQKLVEGIDQIVAKLEQLDPPSPPKKANKLPLKSAVKYGQALDALDKKDKEAAKTKLQEVVKEQPDFVLASLDLDKLMK